MSMIPFPRIRSCAAACAMLLATACDQTATGPTALADAPSFAKGQTGGGGTTTPPPSILPTTAPAPGVLIRESFGAADSNARPAGGKGLLKPDYIHTTIGGFWVEWPGSDKTQWLVPNADQTWKFAACTDDPYEMPSPLQNMGNGCVVSEWFDAVTAFPAALMPFAAPATSYEVSIDAWVAPIAGAYIGLGFSNSGALASNLNTAGLLWIRLRDLGLNGGPLNFELRTGGMSGPVLATGNLGYSGWDRLALRYDPVAHAATLSVDGTLIGTYPVTIAVPKYVGFEGVGVLDNFVVRQ